MEEKKFHDWWLLQCGCKPPEDKMLVGYPFINCGKCGHIYCGSKEQLKKAKKNGTLIKCLKAGYGKPDVIKLNNKYGYFDMFDPHLDYLLYKED